MANQKLIVWVGANILPHEGPLRAWLRRCGATSDEVDDVVQESYCRIAALETCEHIRDGRGYFFQTARNVLREQMRRARVVRIDGVTDLELSNIIDAMPSPERIVAGQRDLQRVQDLIEKLPTNCREVLKLRKIVGLTQRQTAQRLGVTENVVEAQTARGLRLILAALASQDSGSGSPKIERSNAKPARASRD